MGIDDDDDDDDDVEVECQVVDTLLHDQKHRDYMRAALDMVCQGSSVLHPNRQSD